MRDQKRIAVNVPKEMKEEVLKLIKLGEYESISDFLRKAVESELKNSQAGGNDDNILKKRDVTRFIEKLS